MDADWLREAAGVEAAKLRVDMAHRTMDEAATLVSKIPATTTYGLRLKADAVIGTMESIGVKPNNSFIGDALRLADAIFDVIPESGRIA